jgi:hypothetical protein
METQEFWEALALVDLKKNKGSCDSFPMSSVSGFLFYFIFFFAVLGFELRVFTLSHSTISFFVFEIGSHELFAQGWL